MKIGGERVLPQECFCPTSDNNSFFITGLVCVSEWFQQAQVLLAEKALVQCLRISLHPVRLVVGSVNQRISDGAFLRR